MILLEEGWILSHQMTRDDATHTVLVETSQHCPCSLKQLPASSHSQVNLCLKQSQISKPDLPTGSPTGRAEDRGLLWRVPQWRVPLVAGPGCVPRAACSPEKTCGLCSLLLPGAAPSTPAQLGTVYGPFPINPNCSPSLQSGLRGRG